MKCKRCGDTGRYFLVRDGGGTVECKCCTWKKKPEESTSKPDCKPLSWTDLERECLHESSGDLFHRNYLGILFAFAFLRKRLPPAEVCAVAIELLKECRVGDCNCQVADRGNQAYVCVTCRIEAALKAAEGVKP